MELTAITRSATSHYRSKSTAEKAKSVSIGIAKAQSQDIFNPAGQHMPVQVASDELSHHQ